MPFLLRQLLVESKGFLRRLHVKVFAQGGAAALKYAMNRRAVAAGGMAAHQGAESRLVTRIGGQNVVTDMHRFIPLVRIKEQRGKPIGALQVSQVQLIPGWGSP